MPGCARPSGQACLRAAASSDALLAGICAGALELAAAGLLRGRRATHNDTLEFTTAAVARELGLLTDKQAKAQVAYHQRRIDAH